MAPRSNVQFVKRGLSFVHDSSYQENLGIQYKSFVERVVVRSRAQLEHYEKSCSDEQTGGRVLYT
jgi:hypothetical protein